MVVCLSLGLATFGCDDGGDGDGGGGGSGDGGAGSNPGGKATGQGPCEAASECANDVCVALIDGNNPPVYCTQLCGSCPDGFYCDSSTFGLIGLNFCRFGATEPAMPETPPEPPRVPCTTDADCEGALVCATWMGERNCTRPCSVEDDCTISLGGVTFDLATCGQDESQDRTVCLPDEDCFPNAQSCIGGLPGGGPGGGLPGLP